MNEFTIFFILFKAINNMNWFQIHFWPELFGGGWVARLSSCSLWSSVKWRSWSLPFCLLWSFWSPPAGWGRWLWWGGSCRWARRNPPSRSCREEHRSDPDGNDWEEQKEGKPHNGERKNVHDSHTSNIN